MVENCFEGDDNFIGRKGMLSLEHESLSHVWKNIITYHRQFQFSFFPIFFVETNQDNFILFLLPFIFVSCLPFEVLYVCLGLSFSFFFLSSFLSLISLKLEFFIPLMSPLRDDPYTLSIVRTKIGQKLAKHDKNSNFHNLFSKLFSQQKRKTDK